MRALIRPSMFLLFTSALLLGPAVGSASRPTHSPVRDSRRLVVPTPARDPGGRAGHQTPQHGPARGHSSPGSRVAPRTAHARHGQGGVGRRSAGRSRPASAAAATQRNQPGGPHGPALVHGRREGIPPKSRAGRIQRNDDTPDRETLARVHSWQKAQHQVEDGTALPPSPPPAAPDAPGTAGPGTAGPGTDSIFAANLPPPTSVELPQLKSLEDEAATPVFLPSLYDKRGRVALPAPLYGSHEVLLHQNQMAVHDGLTRVRDDDDLAGLRREGKLVALPAGSALRIDGRLPPSRRYSRPWTAEFLGVVSRDFFRAFHEPLQVNSAVRTVAIQQRLLRTNGNAAPSTGDTASPHLTGQAVDIAKRGLTVIQIAWMRAYLEPLIAAGEIDVEEEFQQSCFHVSVYKAYVAPKPLGTLAATGLAQRTSAN